MYVPAHFDEPSVEVMHRFIKQHPLGIILTNGLDGLDANHLPFELATEPGTHARLHAHVARNNPLWKNIREGEEVLIVFRGEEAYISPSWYPSKHEHHRQVPTWNYKVVHAHGRVMIRDDERYVRGLVARLTRTHEVTEPRPWKMTDAPTDYIASMLEAIVGLEVEITRLTGKFKLSQNKEARDINGAADALSERGHDALGQAMRQVIPPGQAGSG